MNEYYEYYYEYYALKNQCGGKKTNKYRYLLKKIYRYLSLAHTSYFSPATLEFMFLSMSICHTKIKRS